MAGGNYHSLAVSQDNKVFGFGFNFYGQLGLGDARDRLVPIQIPLLTDRNITRVFAGSMHSLALTNNSRLYCFGHNNMGQLGLNDVDHKLIPTENTRASGMNISLISPGYIHTLILTKESRVFVFGGNTNGQLGLRDNLIRMIPTENTFFNGRNVTQISAGYVHSLAVTKDHKVYSFGHNFYGQLGLGDAVDKNTPTEITFFNGRNITNVVTGYFFSATISNN